MQPIPNRLRRYRRSRGLSQKDVAQILGLDSSLVSRWENGLAFPTVLNALKLALLYRIWTDTLYTDLLVSLKGEIQKGEAALAQRQHHA
jgi:transcriptional regulator with XRE-family HTH domain